MPEWLSGFLEWLRLNPQLAGVVIGLVAFLEGLAVVGIIMPGIVILFGFGALVGLGVLDLATVWVWCSAGAIAGDGLSFWLGHHFKHRVTEMWPISRYPGLLDQGEIFFRRHGLKSIIIGRFVGPIRPIIPLVAGMMQMPMRIYLPANILAGAFWAPAYLLPGVVFGASIELAQAVAWRLALLLALVGAAVWLLATVVNATYTLCAPRTSRLIDGLSSWSRNHPKLGGVARNLVDPKRPESGSLLMLSMVLLLAAGGALWLLITMPTAGRLAFDAQVLDAVSRLRSPWTDQGMAAFASLGSLRVVGPACLALLGWLLFRRQYLAAWHLAAAGGFGAALALVMAAVVLLLADQDLTVFPGPVSQITLAVSGYGFLAILLTRQLPQRRRLWPYVVSVALVSLAAAGRVYLGVHTISEVLLGTCLGAVWVLALGIAYRRRARRQFLLSPAAGVFYLTLAAALALDVGRRSNDVLRSAFPPPPVEQVEISQWRGGALPLASDEPVSFYFAGPPEALLQALADADWLTPAQATWQTPIAMLQPEPTIQTLPLMPATVGNFRELATRVAPGSPAGQVLALRLWPTQLVLNQSDGSTVPVWAGHFARYELRRVLYFFHFWRRLEMLALPGVLQRRELEEAIVEVPLELPAV